MKPSPEDLVLLGVDPTQAGDVAAYMIVQLCERKYVEIRRQRHDAVYVVRTRLKLEIPDDLWIHDALNALFGDPNDYKAVVLLGGPNMETLPIAQHLLRKARKRVRQAGLIRRLRPSSVLLWARTIGLIVWMAAIAFVAYYYANVLAAVGVGVAGVCVWAIVFSCLDGIGKRRLFFTRKGKKQAMLLGQRYGVEPHAVPYQPIPLLLGGTTDSNKLRWGGNVLSEPAMQRAMAIMAAALNPPHVSRRSAKIRARATTLQATTTKTG